MKETAPALFIDGQVFQSVAWDRGMGKYSIGLLGALTQNPDYIYSETYILFTKYMPLTDEARKALKMAVPQAKFIFADLKIPDDPSTANIPQMQAQNESAVAKIIQDSIGDTKFSYLICALFIDQVCSVFPVSGQKIILFYDLIPLQYSERYSLLSSYNNYLARYKTLFEADLVLTISQTIADDVALNLGISQNKIRNINGAPIRHAKGKATEPSIELPKRFVLMPSGDEIRKNNINAAQGFETYVREAGASDCKLVITSHFTSHSQDILTSYSKNLLFTGNIPETELRWLYEHAEALLFVSEYEGLGLPILEAAEYKLPIVCSDLAVFNEISGDAFYYSDPSDPLSIAEALKAAINKQDLLKKVGEYPAILSRYTWANTAKATLKAIQSVYPSISNNDPKPRLAVLAPSPDGYSAIGKQVMQLHPALSDYFIIDYYLEQGITHEELQRPNYLPFISKTYSAADFDYKQYRKYDSVLYHIGNSQYHLDTIKSALHLPGFAIFHDTHLKDVFEQVLSQHGYMTKERLAAEYLLDTKVSNPKAKCITSIVNNQLGLLVHSVYVREALEISLQPDNIITTTQLKLPTATPLQLIPKKSNHVLTLGLAGIIHPAKGLDVIEQIAQKDEFAECKIHIFGLPLVGEDVLTRLSSYPNVTLETNLTDFQFQQAMSQLDVLINFRKTYHGETSLATLEAMRFGVVPIVKDTGWYAELPSNAALKVASIDELLKALHELINQPEKLQNMSRASHTYVTTEHTYEKYAANLKATLQNQNQVNLNANISAGLRAGVKLSALVDLIRNRYAQER